MEDYPKRILPGCEHIQKLREDLILQLGVLTIARANSAHYDKLLDELRQVTEQSLTLDNSASLGRKWEGVFGDE